MSLMIASGVLVVLLLLAAAPLRKLWRGEWQAWIKPQSYWPYGQQAWVRWVRTWPVWYAGMVILVLALPIANFSTAGGLLVGALWVVCVVLAGVIFLTGRPRALIPHPLRNGDPKPDAGRERRSR